MAELRLDAPIGVSRYLPPQAIAETARAYEASGVIDSLSVWDQLNFFWPPWFWTPENTPMARVLPDLDSFPDPFVQLAYASAAAPGLSLAVATDAIRRSPAELAQTLLTLGNLSGRPATVQMAAGEVKQHRPFGWKRKEGLLRLEDMLQAVRLLAENDEPVDFAGNHWNLDTAWIGNAKQHKPKIWALGGGPKLMDLAARYADGFSTLAPSAASDPGHWEEMVTHIKGRLVAYDRDPDKFDFNLFGAAMLVHEDENVIDRALDNPIVRILTGGWGRINQNDWAREGMESPYPGWHYALKLLPLKMTRGEVDDLLARTTRKHAEKAWIHGTPEQVANQIAKFSSVPGTNWIHLADFCPYALEPEDGAQTVNRTIDVARRLKDLRAAGQA